MIVTSRKAKRISGLSVVTTIAVSALSLVSYRFFVGISLPSRFFSAALLTGVLVGAGWAMASRLAVADGSVRSIGGGWHLAVWGLFFAGTQAASLLAGRPPAMAALLLPGGTGLVAGYGLTLLTRSRILHYAAGERR